MSTTTPRLAAGAHEQPDAGRMCAMEWAAWLAGEPHSDRPVCVCPVVAGLARRVNDRMPDTHRDHLIPVLLAAIGTRSTTADEVTRAMIAADWAVRSVAPLALRLRGHHHVADRLAALAPITSRDSAWAATDAAATATDAADAVGWDVLAPMCVDVLLRMCAVGERQPVACAPERVAMLTGGAA